MSVLDKSRDAFTSRVDVKFAGPPPIRLVRVARNGGLGVEDGAVLVDGYVIGVISGLSHRRKNPS